MRTTAIRGAATAALLCAAALGLAGCVNAEQAAPAGAGSSVSYGNPPSPTTTAEVTSGQNNQAGQHNQADITFLTQAVLLRQQALDIAGLAATGSTNPKVQALATQITTDATQPQVSTLTGYLTQWGQPAPTAASAGQVPGLLSDAQVQQLQAAKGNAFDTQWTQAITQNLTAMQQAVAAVQTAGTSDQVKQVAQQWTQALTAEVAKANAITG